MRFTPNLSILLPFFLFDAIDVFLKPLLVHIIQKGNCCKQFLSLKFFCIHKFKCLLLHYFYYVFGFPMQFSEILCKQSLFCLFLVQMFHVSFLFIYLFIASLACPNPSVQVEFVWQVTTFLSYLYQVIIIQPFAIKYDTSCGFSMAIFYKVVPFYSCFVCVLWWIFLFCFYHGRVIEIFKHVLCFQ